MNLPKRIKLRWGLSVQDDGLTLRLLPGKRLCQATRRLCQVVRAEKEGDVAGGGSDAFELSLPAYVRLRRYALKPIEAFNLAAIHSWGEFYLHDDFYDPKNGEALQPAKPFVPAPSEMIPPARSAANDPDRLLDYHAASDDERFQMPISLTDAAFWNAISTRLDRFPTQYVKVSILRILSDRALPAADEWLVSLWRELFIAYWSDWTDALIRRFGERDGLDILNRAVEQRPWPDKDRDIYPMHWGLPGGLAFRFGRRGNRSDIAIDQVTYLLDRLDERARTNQIMSATEFRSPRLLMWLERRCPENPTYEWSTLAACSCMDWSTARRWLNAGRPLCRLALSALLDLRAAELDKDKRSGLFASYNPSLIDPPAEDEFCRELECARARHGDDGVIFDRVAKALMSYSSIVDPKRRPAEWSPSSETGHSKGSGFFFPNLFLRVFRAA